MIYKYNQAIIAGIIGGAVLFVLAILGGLFGFALSGFSFVASGFNCLFGLLSILTMAGTGALAVIFARHSIHDVVDAVLVSLVAGAVAGAIDGVAQVIIELLRPGGSILGFLGKELTTLVCAPVTIIVWIIIVAIVAAIGGAIYAVFVARIP